MITRDEMPEDNKDIAAMEVDFPRLSENSAASCPVPMVEILHYLSLESPDGDEITAADLRFLRTAQVADAEYWIWDFHESTGVKCYVTVQRKVDGICIGYDEDYWGLTPEQYMLAEYHEMWIGPSQHGRGSARVTAWCCECGSVDDVKVVQPVVNVGRTERSDARRIAGRRSGGPHFVRSARHCGTS